MARALLKIAEDLASKPGDQLQVLQGVAIVPFARIGLALAPGSPLATQHKSIIGFCTSSRTGRMYPWLKSQLPEPDFQIADGCVRILPAAWEKYNEQMPAAVHDKLSPAAPDSAVGQCAVLMPTPQVQHAAKYSMPLAQQWSWLHCKQRCNPLPRCWLCSMHVHCTQ